MGLAAEMVRSIWSIPLQPGFKVILGWHVYLNLIKVMFESWKLKGKDTKLILKLKMVKLN